MICQWEDDIVAEDCELDFKVLTRGGEMLSRGQMTDYYYASLNPPMDWTPAVRKILVQFQACSPRKDDYITGVSIPSCERRDQHCERLFKSAHNTAIITCRVARWSQLWFDRNRGVFGGAPPNFFVHYGLVGSTFVGIDYFFSTYINRE